MSANQGRFVLKLPPEAVASDAELQAPVARIFHYAPVRSVTVDRNRATAVVRFQPDAPPETSNAETISDLLAEADAARSLDDCQPVELLSWTDPRDGSIAYVRMPVRVRGWRKALFLLLAAVTLLLGLLGILLPILPTTPFVLLASYCLVRSSKTLHEKLMASRIFGGFLRDWYIHGGLRPHVRIRAMALVAFVVAASLVVARPPLPIAIAIGVLAAVGLIVIWRLPSIRTTSDSSTDK